MPHRLNLRACWIGWYGWGVKGWRLEVISGSFNRRATESMKEPGFSDIPNKVCKLAGKSKACVVDEFISEIWKRQRLALFPKVGRSPGEPSSHRPICLLENRGKMTELIIYDK